jgi:hypothetical protein
MTMIVRSTPDVARTSALKSIGQDAVVELYPFGTALRLPLVIDPLALAQSAPAVRTGPVPQPYAAGCGCSPRAGTVGRRDIVRVTQLARATFPWVNYHRGRLLESMTASLQFANTKNLLFFFTNYSFENVLNEAQQGRSDDPNSHLGLYVLDGYHGPDKGYEPWNLTDYSNQIDDSFTWTALAHSPHAELPASTLLGHVNQNGTVAFSTVMFYNANAQIRPEHRINLSCTTILPARQASCGWDTLNWRPGSLQKSNPCESSPLTTLPGEFRPFEFTYQALPIQYPEIQVNWQVKLIPSNKYRLQKLTQSTLPHPFNAILRLPTTFPAEIATR